MWLLWLLILVGVLYVLYKVKKKFKSLSPLGTITLCTGAVKTGKTTLAVYLALRSYRKARLVWYIRRIFDKKAEEPLLYSNIPLACQYVPVTTDVLLRKQRINSHSVMLLDEASLVADSQFIKDGIVNMQLLKFFKLFGHMSHGGSLIVDTQSVSDLHYAMKRTINTLTYIRRTRKVPFFLVMDVIEQWYSDDGTVMMAQDKDVDDNLKHVIVPKSVWKMFDTYCYSILTDSKPSATRVVDGTKNTLKTLNIPSFRRWEDIE